MMHGKTVVLILDAVAFSAMGQLFLKSGTHPLAGLRRLEFLLTAAQDMRVLSGLQAWAASTVCWLYVLRVDPLSGAYRQSSLLIPLASIYVFDEQIRRLHALWD